MTVPATTPEPTEVSHLWRCILCGDTRTTLREYAPGTTIACHRVITTERADGEPVRCAGHYVLDTPRFVYRCTECGTARTSIGHAAGYVMPCSKWYAGALCSGHYELDTTPPVPDGWYRDAPARGQRERFVDTVCGSVDFTTGEAAWRLILDAWRVVEVASARADRPATPNREEWFAALQVAVFRVDHPEATSTALDDNPAADVCGWEECC
jgi:hypothetical protein